MDYIKIRLESDMCAASGESSGNMVDSDICINSCGLPYIPARRIKGCLRSAAEELTAMGFKKAAIENIDILFGNAHGVEGLLHVMDGNMKGADVMSHYLHQVKKGKAGSEFVRKNAGMVCVENIFTDVLGQTRLQDGVKVDNTLRFTRVLNQYDPLTGIVDNTQGEEKLEFIAPVKLNVFSEDPENKEAELYELLEASCKTLRHMGLNRNRGLGNVTVEFVREHEEENPGKIDINKRLDEIEQLDLEEEDKIEIQWSISMDAPVSIPSANGYETSVPGRSVIGCMAGEYLKEHLADEVFSDLFLNGKVMWSPLTPVIRNEVSHPTPMMLMELKNGGKKRINRYTQTGNEWTAQKPKTMNGSYAAMTDTGYVIADPLFNVSYHHSIKQEKLYSQNAMEKGMIYGGSILIGGKDKELAKEIIRILQKADLRFGRSKGAQYATCSIKEIKTPRVLKQSLRDIPENEPIFVVLQNDLIINENGVYYTDSESVRTAIAGYLNGISQMAVCVDEQKTPEHPAGYVDVCHYKTISGFQSQWHLQKPHIPAVEAGSVYCFVGNGGRMPERITLGEYTQEGFGTCQILSLTELKKYQRIEKGTIDINTPDQDQYRINQLNTALRVYAAKEVLRRYAREYIATEKNIPISRLRLMLSEAKSYGDLKKLVGSMKTSDISSVNEKGKRTITEELLQDFYGDDNDALRKILNTEPGLYEELSVDKEAYSQVNNMWKLPMDVFLHHMHYQKGDKK